MSGIDEVIAALQRGAFIQADEILTSLGAAKPASALRPRALWAITQILILNFDEDAATALIEIGRRSPNRTETTYDKLLLLTGPLESVLPPAAAQEVRLRIGDYYLRGDEPEEAAPWLSAALAAAPDDPIAVYLEANCRFALYGERQAVLDMEGVLHRAAADTERAYFVGGHTAAFWYRLGLTHERMRNFERAAEFLSEAVARDPGNDTARILLGDILLRVGRFDEVIALLAAVPQYADGYRVAARLQAVALYRIGNSEEALALLQKVAEIDPLGALTFLEIGQIYLQRDELAEAEIALARAFRTNSELAGLRAAIVELETRLGRHLDPDAGLPVMTEFTIPDEFLPRFDDPALLERPDFKAALSNFWRVTHALIIKDVLALYAETGMGYLWALAQPLVFTFSIAAAFIATGHGAPFGTSIVAFLAAGIVPFISFYIRMEAAANTAVRSNVSLLYFRQVTPFALIAAAFVREYLTAMFAFVIIVGAIAAYDKSVAIPDPLEILMALTCVALLATVIGTLLGLAALAMPSIALAEIVISRIMFFFGGAFYYANTLPPRMREYALWNPLLDLMEFIRGGLFSFYDPRYATWQYPLGFIGVGIALVVIVLYSTRRYIVAQ
jgi:capsular polysaccharide transport system permease protein